MARPRARRSDCGGIRILLRTTHDLAEGAGAAGLAGVLAMRDRLAGKTVAVVLSGSNIDAGTLRAVVTGVLSLRDLRAGAGTVLASLVTRQGG